MESEKLAQGQEAAADPSADEGTAGVEQHAHDPAGEEQKQEAQASGEGDENTAPSPAQPPDEYAQASREGNPRIALVGKYTDRVPVQLRDAAHLEKLRGDHGAVNVEVQS